MGASSSGMSLEMGDAQVQEFVQRLAAVEGKVGTCLEEIDRLRTENEDLRDQLRAFRDYCLH